MKKKKRGFKGKWVISVEVHYSSSTAGLLPFFFFFFSLLYLSSSFSLIFKFRGAFSLNERQIFFLLSPLFRKDQLSTMSWYFNPISFWHLQKKKNSHQFCKINLHATLLSLSPHSLCLIQPPPACTTLQPMKSSTIERILKVVRRSEKTLISLVL